jgi:protein TonB
MNTTLDRDAGRLAGSKAEGITSNDESRVSPLALGLQRHLPSVMRKEWLAVWGASWSVALCAHGLVLYALMREPADLTAGGGGQQLDAISVTIVSSPVLESRDPDRSKPIAPAAAAPVDTRDGGQESEPVATDQNEERKQHQEKQKKAEQPTVPAEAIFEQTPRAENQTRKQSNAAPLGGESARSDAASETRPSGPAAGSPGAVREYARYVSLALGKAKPKGTGMYGTVRLRFVISAAGGLQRVEVTKPSGTSKLDDMALAAVGRAQFPVPPTGMTEAQRTFEVPYRFR